MHKFLQIYRDNINGIIFTLCFHILILAFAMNKKMVVKYQPQSDDIVLIQAEIEPVKKPEPPKPKQEKVVQNREVRSSAAVNDSHTSEATTNDPFFDQSYQDELAKAEALMNKVDKQLEKNRSSNNAMADPPIKPNKKDTNLKRNKKKTIYVGKSNIHYALKGRFHVDLPIPIYLAEFGGKVHIDIVVNRDGRVVNASLNQQASSFSDPSLSKYAMDAAKKTVFETSTTAPTRQNGYIVYTFVPQ
ncbi:energy transducer TonB [Halosquirtibacter xylanolyticus]|uniref:energy transducer TonB n=1 Tax=Halosquirtibacter xylanolyticus TaxID=3374599 RepID=UPI0037487EAE|nr:energy transducer TonB [Prolixibacteraceae bacterium]